MDKNITWKAEIVFKGEVNDLTRLAKALEGLPVEINIPEWRFRKHHLAGCWPFPYDRLIPVDVIDKIIDGMPRVTIRYVKDIPGGIRPAHLHIGNEIVLLNQERFRTFVSTMASGIATRLVDDGHDYVELVGSLNALAEMVQAEQAQIG